MSHGWRSAFRAAAGEFGRTGKEAGFAELEKVLLLNETNDEIDC